MYYIDITINPHLSNITVSRIRIKKLVIKIIDYLKLKPNTEIDVHITSNKLIRKLNKQYRGLNQSTDVLSFNMLPQTCLKDINEFVEPPDGLVHLGEIIISYDYAQKQAEKNRITLKREITIILIHGILHLLGYDHELPDDIIKMERKEKRILSYLDS